MDASERKEKLLERKSRSLILNRDPAENTKYAEGGREREMKEGVNYISDTRDPEAWPFV